MSNFTENTKKHECQDCKYFCLHYRLSHNEYKPLYDCFHCTKSVKKVLRLCDKYEKVNVEDKEMSLKEHLQDLAKRIQKMLDLFK